MRLLREAGVALRGARAVVVGRSNIVGKPMAQLLLAESATATIAHSQTRDLPALCRKADVLEAAVGRSKMIQGNWVREGATVIDVGINRGDDGKLFPRITRSWSGSRMTFPQDTPRSSS